MDENPQRPTPPAPAAAAQPAPVYIGNTNIIDRSNMQPTVPSAAPQSPPASPPTRPPADDTYLAASSAFSEAKVLICGVASATSYLLIIYLVKNVWVTAIISAALAFAAIFFAVSSYGRDGKITPLGVIGLSAATITLVYIANILLALAFLHTALTSGYAF